MTDSIQYKQYHCNTCTTIESYKINTCLLKSLKLFFIPSNNFCDCQIYSSVQTEDSENGKCDM